MDRFMPQRFHCTSCGALQYSDGSEATWKCYSCGHRHKTGQFSRLRDWFKWDGVENAWYDLTGNGDSIIELQESTETRWFYELGNQLVLGYEWSWQCYDPSFIAYGYKPDKFEGPIALWDSQSGQRLQTLKGFHYGDLRGAQLLDDDRLITRARDFLIHIWDINSGELLDTLPLPVELNKDQVPIVSSRTFTNLTDQQRANYVNNHDRLSFNVKLMIKAHSDAQCEILGPYSMAIPEGISFKSFEFPEGKQWMRPFEELEGVEGGYCTKRRMSDDRIIIGGTTYGSSGYVYVWDGGFNLTILFSRLGMSASCFEIDGEIRPGVIQVSFLDETMIFEDV